MEFLLPGLVSFIITVLAVPQTIIFAKKFNLLDNPKLKLHPAHIQKRIVPRAGGLAVFAGIVLAMLVFTLNEKHTSNILISLVVLLAVGLLDDKIHLSPYLRLISQFIASFVVVYGGINIKFITNPLGGIINLNTTPQIIILAQILAVIWIVWVMNMINWSKGVDGQMPGIVTVSAIILGLLSLKIGQSSDLSQINLAKLSFITAGASFGLLIFNWHPAKIFPGFSGSTILGFMIAILAIASGAKLATALLVLLIPATDFAYTFLRRILQGRSPVWGDRGHLHHKLLQIGLSHQAISLFYILGSVTLGTVSLSLSSSGKIFAAVLVGAAILGVILWLNFFGGYSEHPDRGNG